MLCRFLLGRQVHQDCGIEYTPKGNPNWIQLGKLAGQNDQCWYIINIILESKTMMVDREQQYQQSYDDYENQTVEFGKDNRTMDVTAKVVPRVQQWKNIDIVLANSFQRPGYCKQATISQREQSSMARKQGKIIQCSSTQCRQLISVRQQNNDHCCSIYVKLPCLH